MRAAASARVIPGVIAPSLSLSTLVLTKLARRGLILFRENQEDVEIFGGD